MSILQEERDREEMRKAGANNRSSGRKVERATRGYLPPRAKGLPKALEEDKAFMDLFREAKVLEGMRGQQVRFDKVIEQMRARWTEVLGHG